MRLTRLTAHLFWVGAVCLIAAPLNAAIITGSVSETMVESRTGGKNFAAYLETTVFPDGWSNSGSKSTAPGVTTGIGSRFNTTNAFGGAFQVSPVLPTAGGFYDVYVTTTNASGAITANSGVSVTGGFGLPNQTPAFGTVSQNAWALVGRLKLNSGVTTPVVTFSEITHSNRMYADAVLFAEVIVPEPATLSLAAMGLIGMIAAGRRK